MALPSHLQTFMDNPIQVLDDGHVQLIDVMGDDNTIVQAARVSYGKGTKRVSADRHLIRYLMRHSHTTPFEMCSITFRIRVPMDAWRQWIRHRTASVNEYSTRYSEALESAQHTKPNQWRTQAKNNKQGSEDYITSWPDHLKDNPPDATDWNGDWLGQEENQRWLEHPGHLLSLRERELQDMARKVYAERLALGVAREQARKDLPLSTYTEAYWKMNLHNLFHFLELRLDSHAQLEIREFSQAIATVVKEWVPWAWEAFEDYRLGGMDLTQFEVRALKALLAKIPGEVKDLLAEAVKGSGLSLAPEGKPEPREVTELKDKFSVLLKRA